MPPISEELLDRIAALIDSADAQLEPRRDAATPTMRVEDHRCTIKSFRDELRSIYLEGGGKDQWTK